MPAFSSTPLREMRHVAASPYVPGAIWGMVTLKCQLPTLSAGPLPRRFGPMDSSTKNEPVPRHWFTDETDTVVPGAPTVGDAVNVRRVVGFRVVVVVVDARVVVVAACVVVVAASVVGVVVGLVVVWAEAAQPQPLAMMTANKAPSTTWARRVTLISHLRRFGENATQPSRDGCGPGGHSSGRHRGPVEGTTWTDRSRRPRPPRTPGSFHRPVPCPCGRARGRGSW